MRTKIGDENHKFGYGSQIKCVNFIKGYLKTLFHDFCPERDIFVSAGKATKYFLNIAKFVINFKISNWFSNENDQNVCNTW